MDDTGIANLALGRLGVSQVIASLTENSTPAKACNRFYAQCRQEALRAHPWGFALRAEPLAEVVGQTFPGWRYVYQYPTGCLTMRAVGDESGLRLVRDLFLVNDQNSTATLQQIKQPFQLAIKNDGASKVVLTDLQTAWGFMTIDVPNPGVFPSDFSSAFADRLAMEVGGPLQAKADLIALAGQRYRISVSIASAASMNESRDDVRPDSPSIACRA